MSDLYWSVYMYLTAGSLAGNPVFLELECWNVGMVKLMQVL